MATVRLIDGPPVALVMMDTRPAMGGSTPSHTQFAFEINRRYACDHGYDLLYLRMKDSVCRHPVLGERHPSYCKLAAVAEALSRGYSLVVFLDSDAFFQNSTLPLSRMLIEYAGNASGHDWDAAFSSDLPFSSGPNAGVQFWNNTPSAQRLLRLWWHLPGGRFHSQHDYEQHALQWLLVHQHLPRIATLGLHAMSLQLDGRGWPLYEHPIAHIDHGRSFYRLLIMSAVLLRASDHLLELPNQHQDRRGGRSEPPGKRGGLFASAAIGGTRALEGYQLSLLRNRLVRHASNVVRDSWQLPRSGCSRSRTILEDFDPTQRADVLLRLNSTPWAATPWAATLWEASDASRSDAGGRAREPSPPIPRLARSRMQAMHEALWGMPLQLVHCSVAGRHDDATHWWMRWRVDGQRGSLRQLRLQLPRAVGRALGTWRHVTRAAPLSVSAETQYSEVSWPSFFR